MVGAAMALAVLITPQIIHLPDGSCITLAGYLTPCVPTQSGVKTR